MEWKPIATAPFDRDLELAVLSADGVHALVFACRRVLGGWISAQTKQRIELYPTHWREWETAGPTTAPVTWREALEYRRHAIRCRQLAAAAGPFEKKSLLDIAAEWERRANEAEATLGAAQYDELVNLAQLCAKNSYIDQSKEASAVLWKMATEYRDKAASLKGGVVPDIGKAPPWLDTV